MKQLYWSKLDNVEGTVFAGGGGDDAHDASVLGDLLEHFGPQAAKVVVKEAKPKKPKAVQLLDPKRVQNLNIVLAQFKDLKSADELVRALEDCDAAHLTADNCAGLAEHCPEAAECEACAAYLDNGGDPALLGRADKFCAAVAPLQKTLRARLDAIRAKLTYDEDAQAIRDDAKVLSWAAEQARSSDKLKRIMLLLLKLGNALNRGMTFAEATAPRGFAPRPARRASPAVDVDIDETSDDDDYALASRSNSAEEDDLTVFDLASRKRYEAAVRSHHKLAATKARFASERGRRDSDRSELTVDSSCPDADDDGGPACYNFLNQGGDDTVGCVMSAPSLNAALFGDADDDDGGGGDGARTDGGDQCAIS